MILSDNIIDEMITLVVRVGCIVMGYYNSEFGIEMKNDKSPVTTADREANRIITEYLSRIAPEIPIISEEGNEEYNNRIINNYTTFWLIDPIDGTKSFIKKNGHFTINIALIHNFKPHFGIIHDPISRYTYFTGSDGNSYKFSPDIRSQVMRSEYIDYAVGLRLVTGTRSIGGKLSKFIDTLDIYSKESVSSSIKFCMLAEGKFDIYPNFNKIHIWDIAAGHAILKNAGGDIITKDGSTLLYDRKSLDAPSFIALNLSAYEYINNKLDYLR